MNEGQKFDQDKVRLDLYPVEALWETSEVLTFGAKKYGDRNWEKGLAYSRCYGAALRHLAAWWSSIDNDPETGLSHLAHAHCCIAFLQTFTQRGAGVDDRPLNKLVEETCQD